MWLRYTQSGLLVLFPQDDPGKIIDAMLQTGYSEDYCISLDAAPDFIARLMKAGFLVMSARIETTETVIFLPKLHTIRSVLHFDNVHIKKSIQRHLSRYELRFDTDFDHIVDRCIAVHGDDWLTPPLIDAVREIRAEKLYGVYPVSFALYRNGKLVAGEFGITAGNVYTAYSGYYDESNAGTVQIILAARYLQEHGFAFFDLGMPLDYKTTLGAINIDAEEFVALFRAAQI